MQEKKFKVLPLKDLDSFKKGKEYWVYSTIQKEEVVLFLLHDEVSGNWKYYDSSNFNPAKERTADEILNDFQDAMKKSGV